MRNVTIVTACCVWAVLCIGGARLGWADEGARGVFEHDAVEVLAPEGVKFGQVSIDNHLGNVSVRGHDHESIAIKSFKRADDDATLERLVVSLVPDGQGRVSISTALRAGAENKPVRAGSIAIDLVVFVPRKSAVDAEIWNGELLVSNVDNGASLVADKGRIAVKQVSGAVAADLRLGDQVFAELLGDLRAHGIEGTLDLNTVRGKVLEASIVRGGIVGAKLKFKQIQVRSVFGDIDLSAELMPGGSYKIASRMGNVSIRFSGPSAVAVSVGASKVTLASEMSPRHDGQHRWYAYYGQRSAKIVPAELELQAPTGTVLVRHF